MRRLKAYATQSDAEEALMFQMMASGTLMPQREYRFHPSRRWRFDFAFPVHKVAVEVEGGIWTNGRHVRPAGFEDDCEKYNAAASLGWTVYRVTPSMVKSGVAIRMIEAALNRVERLGI